MLRSRSTLFGLAAAATVALTAFVLWPFVGSRGGVSAQNGSGIAKIKHVVIVMQENRSFDSYFGTYPGADGIAMKDGQPVACLPDGQGGCARPYHDTNDFNRGGPHNHSSVIDDVDGGKMDGYLLVARKAIQGCAQTQDPRCGGNDVMGYHDEHEVPNYWRYARDFVLQDHLFEPNASWSLPQHLYMVSEWSAKCSKVGDPMSCRDAVQTPDLPLDFRTNYTRVGDPGRPDYAWTDLTYLLHKSRVTWAYYVMDGDEPDCRDDSDQCPPIKQSV